MEVEVVDLSDPLPEPTILDMEPSVTKKRRFFAEDSPEKPANQHDSPGTSSPLRNNTETTTSDKATATAVTSGFDANLLENLVGETLEQDVIQRLRELSGDNIERGRRGHLREKEAWLTLFSYQPLSRWHLEDFQAA